VNAIVADMIDTHRLAMRQATGALQRETTARLAAARARCDD
jgi:hypothetical protein